VPNATRARLAVLAVATVITTAGCAVTSLFPQPPSPQLGGAGVVSATGSVGPLRIDRSTPAQIEAFAGPPEYTGTGRFRPLIREFPPFVAFGYRCHRVLIGGIPTMSVDKSTGMPGDSHVDCRIIYWVNSKTGRLAGFSTDSRRFHTPAGVRPGTSLAAAKRREHRPTLMDSPSALHVATANADLLIYATIVTPKHGGWQVGKTVAALALESKHHFIGLEFV
jgi:hypothetical protein